MRDCFEPDGGPIVGVGSVRGMGHWLRIPAISPRGPRFTRLAAAPTAISPLWFSMSGG
jgi:hypothetical protein